MSKSDFHHYKNFAHFMDEFPLFYHSGLGWTRLRNECGIISDWLNTTDAVALGPHEFSSSMFWKESPPSYREYELSSVSSASSLEWVESDAEDISTNTNGDLNRLESISNLNLNE
jgi:hypothetical protein